MKNQKMLFMLLFSIAVFASCKKEKDKNVMPPVLTTTAITAITPTTATGGGTISNNGGSEITSSGICWSKTNVMPTISDDTAKTTIATGSFTVNLKDLSGGALYYVRAYATNSAGTGYGAVVTFTIGNAGPEARNIKVTGEKTVGAELTGTYTYFDNENNAEAGTSFQWYAANDSIGAALTPIAGATASKLTLADNQKDKFIVLGITAKASAGTSPGAEKKSYWVGPVGGETVTFMYNGQSVTYGIITSSVTGRKWLDRNLGAKRMATSLQDYQAYGDLFQYGRPADGHQLINWTGPETATSQNGSTTLLSGDDTPDNALFVSFPSIINPCDWRNPQNGALWQAPNFINNVCPEGWRLPTNEEWTAENISNRSEGFDKLKLAANGFRRPTDATIMLAFGEENYWTSTRIIGSDNNHYAYYFQIFNASSTFNADYRSYGKTCRCIKK